MSDAWAMAIDCIRPKKHEKSPVDTLNRLAREYFPGVQVPRLSQECCSAVYREWTVEELARLELRHSRAQPIREDGPLVAFSYRGRVVVLDGNNRLSKWRAEGSKAPRPVVLITLDREKENGHG